MSLTPAPSRPLIQPNHHIAFGWFSTGRSLKHLENPEVAGQRRAEACNRAFVQAWTSHDVLLACTTQSTLLPACAAPDLHCCAPLVIWTFLTTILGLFPTCPIYPTSPRAAPQRRRAACCQHAQSRAPRRGPPLRLRSSAARARAPSAELSHLPCGQRAQSCRTRLPGLSWFQTVLQSWLLQHFINGLQCHWHSVFAGAPP